MKDSYCLVADTLRQMRVKGAAPELDVLTPDYLRRIDALYQQRSTPAARFVLPPPFAFSLF